MGTPLVKASCERRELVSDEYQDKPVWQSQRQDIYNSGEAWLRLQYGKFWHEIYRCALQVDPYTDRDTKALYLYIDYIRVATCRFVFSSVSDGAVTKTVLIQYRNDEHNYSFHDSAEVLPRNRYPLLSSYFSHMFRYQCSDKAGYLSWGYTVYKYKQPLTHEQQHQLNLDTIPTIVI